MARNTSILLGEHFEKFVDRQVKSGKFASASEVIRSALRLFEHEESRKKRLVSELKKGEQSGFVEAFDRKQFLNQLHGKSADSEA